MRLDKWLKLSRLIKRRTVANEACDKGKVKINNQTAKASAEVKVGDQLKISLGNLIKTVEVIQVPVSKNVSTQEARELYKLLSEQKTDDDY